MQNMGSICMSHTFYVIPPHIEGVGWNGRKEDCYRLHSVFRHGQWQSTSLSLTLCAPLSLKRLYKEGAKWPVRDLDRCGSIRRSLKGNSGRHEMKGIPSLPLPSPHHRDHHGWATPVHPYHCSMQPTLHFYCLHITEVAARPMKCCKAIKQYLDFTEKK